MSRETWAGARCTLSTGSLLRVRNVRGHCVSGEDGLEKETTLAAKMVVQEES